MGPREEEATEGEVYTANSPQCVCGSLGKPGGASRPCEEGGKECAGGSEPLRIAGTQFRDSPSFLVVSPPPFPPQPPHQALIRNHLYRLPFPSLECLNTEASGWGAVGWGARSCSPPFCKGHLASPGLLQRRRLHQPHNPRAEPRPLCRKKGRLHSKCT